MIGKKGNVLKIKSADGKEIIMPKRIYRHSKLISHCVDDLEKVGEISFENVDSKIFHLIIEYMNNLLSPQSENWSEQFLENNIDDIPALLIASQYLEFDELSLNISSFIANKIKLCQNPNQISQSINLKQENLDESSRELCSTLEWTALS